jgi:hypothetical protein
VAPATTRHCDEFYRDVMYCVIKWQCIVVNTMDCYRLCRNLNCRSLFCSCMCMYKLYHLFWKRGHVAAARGGSCIFIDDVSQMNILAYIRRFHITDEYIHIFLGTKEYKELYSSVLRSSVISSVNQGIYSIFLSSIAIFINCNR